MDGTHDLERWECTRHEPALLLGLVMPGRHLEIKVADRFYRVFGVVQAVCPVCGSQHRLDVTQQADARDG